MAKTYTPDFRKDAVRYVKEHTELTHREAADKLGVPYHTLYGWVKEERRKAKPEAYDEKTGNLTDLEKENLRLQRELRDAKDALEILKKAISILGD